MTELICIVCPKGCRLKVDEENGYVVSGNSCPRGAEYGRNELLNPVRTVTSTVAIEGGIHRRLPVKTSRPVPKGKMSDVVRTLDGLAVKSPVKTGDVIVANAAGTGADVIATRDM